jgi:hypothetical protein
MSYPDNILISAASHRRGVQSATGIYILGVLMHESIPRCPNLARHRFCFDSFVAGVSPSIFKRMYRMDRGAFEELCELVLKHSESRRRTSSRLTVSARLAMTIRWLAGGSYLDISMSHYVSIPTFYFVVDQTIADLNDILTMSFRFNDAEYLQSNSDGFSRFGGVRYRPRYLLF